jgi:hypothetical protein
MEQGYKTGLRRSRLSAEHTGFSLLHSMDVDKSRTILKARILKGNHLLASDIMSKPPCSDPVIFGWCGITNWSSKKDDIEKEWMSPEVSATVESNENRGWDDNLDFKVSSCIQGTLDPTWDEELEFDVGKAIQEYVDFERALLKKKLAEEEKPMIDDNKENQQNTMTTADEEAEESIPLDPKHTIDLLMKIGMILYVRDADPYYNNNEIDGEDKLVPIPEDIAYDELGRVIVPLKEVIEKARYANGALVANCTDHAITKTPGMPSMSYKLNLGSLTLGATFSIGDDNVGKALKAVLGCPGPESEDGVMTAKQLLKVLKDRISAKPDKNRARSASPGSRFTAGSRMHSRANSRAGSRVNSPRSGARRPRTTGSLANSLSRLASPTRSSSPVKLQKPWEKMKESKEAELSGNHFAQHIDLLATFDERFESVEAADTANEIEPETSPSRVATTVSTAVGDGTVVGETAREDGPMLDPTLLLAPTGGDESAPPPLEDNKNRGSEVPSTTEGVAVENKDNKEGEREREREKEEEEEKDEEKEKGEGEGEGEGDGPKLASTPAVGALEKVADQLPEATSESQAPDPASLATSGGTPKKSDGTSQIPVGTGSKGAKSLRKALQDDDGASALQQTLRELKSLTRESLEGLAGRLSTIEKRMNGDESYKLREKEAKEALKRKSRERREEFRKFKEQSRIEKAKRDAKEKMHRGPEIDFVHGSKIQGTISHAQISPPDISTGGNGGYEFAPPGGGDQGGNPYADGPIDLAPPGGGDQAGNPYADVSDPPPPATHHHQHQQGPHELNNRELPSVAPARCTPDWKKVDLLLRSGDAVAAYVEVLDRGAPHDLGRLLNEGKVHPSLLSAGILNRVCDMVALLLSQGAGEYAETCLLFILSILRDERGAGAGNPGQPGRGLLLLNRTRQSLSEALGLMASGEIPSKQAVLAGLLQAQLSRS